MLLVKRTACARRMTGSSRHIGKRSVGPASDRLVGRRASHACRAQLDLDDVRADDEFHGGSAFERQTEFGLPLVEIGGAASSAVLSSAFRLSSTSSHEMRVTDAPF